ncbi:MAG: MmgE/PrpD family protein [Acidimicrobiales bacterium]
MPDVTLAEQLGAFAATSTFDGLPADVVASVRQRVLDTLGICVAASSLDTSAAARAYAAAQGGTEQAHAVGMVGQCPATVAAFVNGVLAHSLDYDDTHLPSIVHPSASVIPSALAAGEEVGAGGGTVIAGIACGLEVCVRLGMAGYDASSGSSVYFDHGQHATSICGALGAAVAAARVYGFDAAGITNALGVAASMGSGIIEANRAGGTVKRMHCGWAAHAGVSAAQLVHYGFTGPPTVLEGRFGFFEAWLHGRFDASAVTGGLGSQWAVPGIFFKPYPANHFTHTAIDAGAGLRRRGVDPGEIESMELGVAGPIVRTIGEPIDVKRAPETGYMAQFSGPYAVVAGLLGGGGLGVGLDDFTDALARDPRRRQLMGRVTVVEDAACTAAFPHQFPSVLRARLQGGSEVEERVMTNWGGPDRPLGDGDLATKFEDNARRALAPEAVAEVESLVTGLDTLEDMGRLLAPLGAASANSRPGGKGT